MKKMKGIKNFFHRDEIINNDVDHIQAIEILIRLYCFQQEIEDKINNSNGINNNILKSGMMISKDFLKNYKNYFGYENFLKTLKESKSLDYLKESNGIINYEKLDEDKTLLYLMINDMIKINQNFLKDIEEKNKKIRNNKRLKDEPCKILYKEQNGEKLSYIEEYELISDSAYSLIQKQLSFQNFAYFSMYMIVQQYLFLYISIF